MNTISDPKEEITKEELDEMLCLIDDRSIASGQPILSVLVVHDDGAPSTAFLRTVEKHKHRKPGESDKKLVKRIRRETHAYYKAHPDATPPDFE